MHQMYKGTNTNCREKPKVERGCITNVGETDQIDNLAILTKNQESMERWGKNG